MASRVRFTLLEAPVSWTNRFRLTGVVGDGAFGLGDLLVDALEGAPGPVVLVLVVEGVVLALVARAGRPRLSEHVPVREVLAGVAFAPGGDDVGLLRDAGADDEGQAGVLNRFLVRGGHHAGVGDDGHVGQVVGGHERLDGRDHREGLCLVALERLDHQRESRMVGEQPDRDLRFEAAFLGEPRLAEPVTLVGFEVERADVIQHEAGRAEPGVGGARGRNPLPEGLFRERR